MQAGNTYFDSDVPTIALRSLFQKYDRNSSGYLEENELKLLLEDDLGLRSDQRELYTLIIDRNGDHCVSFDEFASWLRSEEKFQNIDNSTRYAILCQAVNYFKMFDRDNTNTLNHEEFRQVMVSIGCDDETSVQQAFDAVDCHGNGIISFWEFLKWLNWLPL